MKVALISGTSIARSNLFDDWTIETVRTEYGETRVKTRGDLIVINRHGFDSYLPPHAINFRANIAALRALGVTEAVSINSVGSLCPELGPGTLVSCDDYIGLVPATFQETELRSLAPVIPNHLLPSLIEGFPEPIHTGKIYVQMRGPRFETRAEIRVIRHWGDVVGMTMASEADLSQEAGIGYNSFCMIDNYAHGLTDDVLTDEAFRRIVESNQARVNSLVRHFLTRLGK